MSSYFRENPRFAKYRGKSGDELLEELSKQFGEDSSFFDTRHDRSTKDPFERHTSFSKKDPYSNLSFDMCDPRIYEMLKEQRQPVFDSATDFGQGINLDRDKIGFPFDDDAFGRRGDIRSHLDDLAARHPEFADQLLWPPWADATGGGGGSLHRNRNRRGSHDHPDEDARSQASGSSAASGASSHSSVGEAARPAPRNPTVDVGQHQHNMENPQQQQQPQQPQQQQRNVRSMSAPPENRNNQDPQLSGPQRFVSRVEITPTGQQLQQQQQQQANQNQTHNQTQPESQSQREKSPAPPQKSQQATPQPQQQQSTQQSNVRHIPIFVEGRDKPVLAKDVDEPDFPRRQQSPPQFQRPSYYQQHYNRHPGWSSTFQDPFFDQGVKWPSHQSPPSHPHTQTFRHPQQQEKPRTHPVHHPETQHQNQRAKPQPQSQPQPQPQPHPQQKPQTQNEPQPEPPKPKQQIQPKDPLEKVALVQKEVDALNEQVKQYTGNSRQDKQYMYLDEMLTRELIKLDDIDTEGKENVRQARKQAIKSIQESISLLESKAPLPGQQINEQLQTQENKESENVDSVADKPVENMETSEEPVIEEHKAIPLPPPSPSTPTKNVPEVQSEVTLAQQNESNVEAPQSATQAVDTANANSNEVPEKVEENQIIEQTNNTAIPLEPIPQAMEVRQTTPVKEFPLNTEQIESQALIMNEQNQALPDVSLVSSTEKPKKEPPPVPAKPGKSPKKAKKTKKQPEPVSETAIPLPAPGQSI